MKILTAMFFSTVYWKNLDELKEAKATINEGFGDTKVITSVDGDLSEAQNVSEFDTLLVIPCSGAVQPHILRLAEKFEKVILFAGYVPGNYVLELTDKMLCKNAAPTVMDVYSVLKRDDSKTVILAKNHEAVRRAMNVLDAYSTVKNGKITVIKGPEPWVISVSRDYEKYEKQLGITVDVTTQDELIDLYNQTAAEEAMDIYRYYRNDADEIVEPTEDDIMKCARLAKAMLKLIQIHQSTGIAIACFDLIGRIKVNPCLGVAYINGETDYFAACEGDIDSAVTMLLMKGLTSEKPWMANPCMQADDTINFAHCTAPLRVRGEKQKFILRNHHETSVGASPRVFYDLGLTMSLFRYSGVENVLTVNRGKSIEGRYEPNCRTQMRVEFEDPTHYFETVQGCHQVMTFEDITEDMKTLCKLLGINTI